MTTTSILGETRQPARIWPDGSYTCPFCGGAVLAEWTPLMTNSGYTARCRNPVCEAGPTTRAAAEQRRAESEARRAESERRRREHAAWSIRYEQALAARQEQWNAWKAEAEQHGYCWQCLRRSDGRKRVKHRTSDYHERLARGTEEF